MIEEQVRPKVTQAFVSEEEWRTLHLLPLEERLQLLSRLSTFQGWTMSQISRMIDLDLKVDGAKSALGAAINREGWLGRRGRFSPWPIRNITPLHALWSNRASHAMEPTNEFQRGVIHDVIAELSWNADADGDLPPSFTGEFVHRQVRGYSDHGLDELTVEAVSDHLDELESAGLIRFTEGAYRLVLLPHELDRALMREAQTGGRR